MSLAKKNKFRRRFEYKDNLLHSNKKLDEFISYELDIKNQVYFFIDLNRTNKFL